MRRVALGLGLAVCAVLGPVGRAFAGGQEEPPPVGTGEVTTTTEATSATTAPGTTAPGAGSVVPPVTSTPGSAQPTLPPGCEPLPAPEVVFVGRLTAAAGGIGRFQVEAVRSDPDGVLAIGRKVDVELDNDLRFLALDHEYLVAAEAGGAPGLRSKVHVAEPLFGGDQVVGVDDPTAECPVLADPITVRRSDGGAVDTGVLSGFFDDKRGIAMAFLRPAGVVLAFFVALLLVKYVFIMVWRAAARVRRRRRRWQDARLGRRGTLTTSGS